MKKYFKKLIVLFIVILVTFFAHSICRVEDELKGHINELSEDEVIEIRSEIDSRVSYITEVLDNKFYGYYGDYYEHDKLLFRYAEQGSTDEDNYVQYRICYGRDGRIIYCDVTHYRGPAYSMYFYEDQLLHTEVGVFYYESKGDIDDIKNYISKHPEYRFILEDIELCLQYAYK